MSKAVLDANVNGIIITIDPLPHDQKIYWNCIADINGKKSRRDLLKKYRKELENIIFIQGYSPDSIDKLGMSRINFAFVDGMHNYTSVLEEYNMIKRNQNAGDIIIFDDIQAAKYSEVGKLIKEIELSGEYTLQEVWSSPNRGYAIMTNKVNKTKSDG
jgi:precorrin-6B methylase 2